MPKKLTPAEEAEIRKRGGRYDPEQDKMVPLDAETGDAVAKQFDEDDDE